MPSQNTLELAKQGDPTAIATILTYHLTQRYNIEASVIRLGDYLSVLVEADFPPDQAETVQLICNTLHDLGSHAIATIEVSGRQVSDRELRWNQTIELDGSPGDRASIPTSSTSPASPDDPWSALLDKLVQRPEMLAIVTFALVAVFWELYTDWIHTVESTPALSGTKLARRLGVHSRTLNSHRTRPNFREWSQDLDPDGIAWSYDGQVFLPIKPEMP